jgi:hypothetical protein
MQNSSEVSSFLFLPIPPAPKSILKSTLVTQENSEVANSGLDTSHIVTELKTPKSVTFHQVDEVVTFDPNIIVKQPDVISFQATDVYPSLPRKLQSLKNYMETPPLKKQRISFDDSKEIEKKQRKNKHQNKVIKIKKNAPTGVCLCCANLFLKMIEEIKDKYHIGCGLHGQPQSFDNVISGWNIFTCDLTHDLKIAVLDKLKGVAKF